ncbi:MAG: hypothetical protein KDB65_00240 [Calditrichaeota bacterium]|nr:hypothetical protein [Calditrichota bacterium]MCB9368544.1 hypothetical protein [Calditrichota bacterium]
MTIIRISLLALLLFGTAAMAADDPYADPDWGYSFMDPHYLPTSAPAELEAFWNKFIPMLEANWSAESAYLRENSKELLSYARDVKGSLDDGTPYQKKFYNEAAADLVRACKELRTLSYGAPSAALYSEMHKVSDAYIRLANLCE